VRTIEIPGTAAYLVALKYVPVPNGQPVGVDELDPDEVADRAADVSLECPARDRTKGKR
jgi:hypothetical protein